MNLPTHLSPQAALARLDAVYANELSSAAEGLALIALVDSRKDYLAAGYSCMKSYCTGHMGMTEDVAAKRLLAARTAQRFPRILEMLAKGRLSLSAVVVLSAHLNEANANDLLDLASGRTRSEIQFLLESRLRRAALEPGFALDGAAASESPEDAPGHPAFAGVFANSVTSPRFENAPGHPATPAATRRGWLAPSAEGACEVRLTLTSEEREVLQQVQALASHTEWGGDPALVYARAMKLLAEYLLAQKLGKGTGDAATSVGKGRRIPMAIKFAVWKRDGGSCSFVGPNGHRCGETHYLDFDHVVPVAMGGPSTLENIRLLCSAHNQHEAERVLGREHMQSRREIAHRERARVRAAAASSAGRAAPTSTKQAETRSEGLQARYADIIAALRTLGYSEACARAEAGKADAQPNASLQECVRLALRALTQDVRHRGERMARCTT